eukprot:gene8917-8071_t
MAVVVCWPQRCHPSLFESSGPCVHARATRPPAGRPAADAGCDRPKFMTTPRHNTGLETALCRNLNTMKKKDIRILAPASAAAVRRRLGEYHVAVGDPSLNITVTEAASVEDLYFK